MSNSPFFSTSIQDEIYKDQLEHGFMTPENNAEWSLPNLTSDANHPTPIVPSFGPFGPAQWNPMYQQDYVPMGGLQNYFGEPNRTWINPMPMNYGYNNSNDQFQPKPLMNMDWTMNMPNVFFQTQNDFGEQNDIVMADSATTVSTAVPSPPIPIPPPPPQNQVSRVAAVSHPPPPRKTTATRRASPLSLSSSSSSSDTPTRFAVATKKVRRHSGRRLASLKKTKKATTSRRAATGATTTGLEADRGLFQDRCRKVSRSKIEFVLDMFDLNKGLSKNPEFEELERRLYQYAQVDPTVEGSLPDAWNDVWTKCANLHGDNSAISKKKRRQYVDQHQAQIHWRMSAYFVRAVANTSRFQHPISRRIDVMKRISFVLTLGFNGGCTPTLLIPVNTWKKKEFRAEIKEFFDEEPPKQWGTFDVAKDAFLESSRLLVELEKRVMMGGGEMGMNDDDDVDDVGGVMDEDAVITNEFDLSDL